MDVKMSLFEERQSSDLSSLTAFLSGGDPLKSIFNNPALHEST
jgi:hypothetical protein